MQKWKTQTYPGIRAEAEQVGAVIYFCDEAGIRSDHHAGTTWAPVGRTPVVKTTGARHAVNMISAVTAQGALRLAVYNGTLTATAFIDFCKRLLHDAPGPVFLAVDGHPAHRATATKKFVTGTDDRLRCSSCPATHPSSTPTSGSARTSSTTAPPEPATPAPKTSRPKPSARYAARRNCRTSSAGSSPTPTSLDIIA